MAHTSGTATNYADLLDKFITFVTTGLASGQNWTKLDDVTSGLAAPYDRQVYFMAPGLTGTDTIFTQIATKHNVAGDWYNWEMYGATGHSLGLGWLGQPGRDNLGVEISLWNDVIPYWFIADGRSAKIIAKVATVYESAYLGLMIPYGTPAEYPYPLFIGGTSQGDQNLRFSETSEAHAAFWNPYLSSQAAHLQLPGGLWIQAANFNGGGPTGTGFRVWPYGQNDMIGTVMGSTTDYTLPALVLHSNGPQKGVYGELDGVYWISGLSNASENIVTIAGVSYLVVQNCFRTTAPAIGSTSLSFNQFAAFKLS